MSSRRSIRRSITNPQGYATNTNTNATNATNIAILYLLYPQAAHPQE